MKKLLLLTLAVVFVLAFSACNTNTSQSAIENVSKAESKQSVSEPLANDIKSESKTEEQTVPDTAQPTASAPQTPVKTDAAVTRDEAIDIALKKAGLKRAEVYDLEAELDYERGVKVWEVDFEKGYTD